MARSADPNVALARLEKLKRLAEDDCQDENMIAEARKRIKLREIERVSLHSGTEIEGTLHTATDNGDNAQGRVEVKEEHVDAEAFQAPGTLNVYSQTPLIEENLDFDEMVEFLQDLREDEGESAIDILSCPACLMLPPDDPVLTSCLCLYCMECFTEMVARARSKNTAHSLACLGYDESIEGYLTLSQHLFKQLLEVCNVHEEASTGVAMPESEGRTNDLDILWHQRSALARPIQLAGEHSRSSPELGIGSNGVNDPSSSDDDDSLNDGFSDMPNRSDGYEIDEEAEYDPTFVTSDCGNPVDPRHVALSSECDDSNDEGKTCLNEVGSSEIEDLLQPASQASNFPAPADEQRAQEQERGAEEGDHEVPLLIDLTEDGDIIEQEITNGSDDDRSNSGGSEDSSDGAMKCSCPTCIEQQTGGRCGVTMG
jgi:hypothetical protein